MGNLDFKVCVYRAVKKALSRREALRAHFGSVDISVCLYSDLSKGDVVSLRYDQDDELIEVVSNRRLTTYTDVLITGPGGLGKTWLGAQLREHLTGKLIYLDLIAHVSDEGKWLVSPAKLGDLTANQRNIVVIGNCDNMSELLGVIDPDLIIFPIPPVSLFKAVAAMKKNEAALNGLPPQWISSWDAQSRFSIRDYGNWLADKISIYLDKLAYQSSSAALQLAGVHLCFLPEPEEPINISPFLKRLNLLKTNQTKS